MHAFGRNMLQKAAQEFVRRKRHRLALMVTTITIVEGDTLVTASNDSFVAERGAMHIPSEILQDEIGVLHWGPCRHDPSLVPRDMRKRNVGQCRRARARNRPRKRSARARSGTK